MPFISNVTNTTYDQIMDIGNSSSLPEFMVKINTIAYGGYFSFFILLTIFIVLFISSQKVKDQPLNNLMYSAAACSLLGFILRAVQVSIDGVNTPFLNDYFLWIFPVITVVLGAIIWATKN